MRGQHGIDDRLDPRPLVLVDEPIVDGDRALLALDDGAPASLR
jgi:hypothetical protein